MTIKILKKKKRKNQGEICKYMNQINQMTKTINASLSACIKTSLLKTFFFFSNTNFSLMHANVSFKMSINSYLLEFRMLSLQKFIMCPLYWVIELNYLFDILVVWRHRGKWSMESITAVAKLPFF